MLHFTKLISTMIKAITLLTPAITIFHKIFLDKPPVIPPPTKQDYTLKPKPSSKVNSPGHPYYPPVKSLSEESKNEIVLKYTTGTPVKELTKLYGKSVSTIQRVLMERDITYRDKYSK